MVFTATSSSLLRQTVVRTVGRTCRLRKDGYLWAAPCPSNLTLSSCFSSSSSSTDEEENDNNKGVVRSKKLPRLSNLLPGLGLAAGTALCGFGSAAIVSSAFSVPISGIPVSILLGMAVKNSVGYPNELFQPGLTVATRTILQGGIVCVAAKLSFYELVTTGFTGLPVVVASVTAGLLFVPWAGRQANLPHRLSLLLAAGTSICGVTAITALAPAIQAPPRDVAVAIANTVAFGTLGMLAYPYLFHAICSSPEQVGMCLGTAIHDTSQVLGSALAYKESFQDEVAFQTAAVTKLVRNLGLAVAIPVLTYAHVQHVARVESQHATTSRSSSEPSTVFGLMTFSKYVPNFLVAFIAMSAFRSGGDFVFSDVEVYHVAMNFIGNDLSKYLLGTAMAGVGLSTSAAALRGVGWKPFAVGGSGALVVGGTGFFVASMIS